MGVINTSRRPQTIYFIWSFKVFLELVNRLSVKCGLRRSYSQLSLEILRILMGLLGFAYFAWILRDFRQFTSQQPSSLIDHVLSSDIFWFTRLSLFQPFFPDALHLAFLLIALMLCLLIIAGIRVRIAALMTYFICFSVQRWNFQVIFVDDLMANFIFFWLIFLPVGKGLRLNSFWNRQQFKEQWSVLKIQRTQSLVLDLFVLNIFIAYVTAGLSKLTSPLWQSGEAVEVILRTPVSRLSHLDVSPLRPLLIVLNYGNLLIEPLIPFLLFQRKWKLLRQIGFLAQLSFHFFIILTLGIPFANLLLLSTAILFFSSGDALPESLSEKPQRRVAILIFYIVMTFFCNLQTVPYLQPLVNASFVANYMIGMVQNYNLFDWIDKLNYQVKFQLLKFPKNPFLSTNLDVEKYIPRETRFVVLAFSLVHHRWQPIATFEETDQMHCSLIHRLSSRVCKDFQNTADERIRLDSYVTRLITAKQKADPLLDRAPIFHMQCHDGQAVDFVSKADCKN